MTSKQVPPPGGIINEPHLKRPVPIHVQRPDRQETLTLPVPLGMSQDNFVFLVADHLQVSSSQMYVTFRGRPLSGSDSLWNAGIREGNTVQAHLRLRGG
ncbi:uncharacterized protein [Diadema antillarum]|uniref:uncharacterized protein n=1 Tax=Diadema antillarum TaxID=105358 RepID=UPI003A87E03A